jgi:hypothetical protein
MKYNVEMASDDVMYFARFMNICSGFQIILSLLAPQSESLQCWYY